MSNRTKRAIISIEKGFNSREAGRKMIRVIRTDGLEILLNADLIKTIERNAHTTITLTTGEKIAVKNEMDDVIIKIRAARIGIDEENKAHELVGYVGRGGRST